MAAMTTTGSTATLRVEKAMQRAGAMYDMATEEERRSLFLNTYEPVAQYAETGDASLLAHMAESLHMTVRLRAIPQVVRDIRKAHKEPIKYGEEVNVDDVIKMLTEVSNDVPEETIP
jgi:hypothetical protein